MGLYSIYRPYITEKFVFTKVHDDTESYSLSNTVISEEITTENSEIQEKKLTQLENKLWDSLGFNKYKTLLDINTSGDSKLDIKDKIIKKLSLLTTSENNDTSDISTFIKKLSSGHSKIVNYIWTAIGLPTDNWKCIDFKTENGCNTSIAKKKRGQCSWNVLIDRCEVI